MNNNIIKYESDTGLSVEITAQDVKNVLCKDATDKEIIMFLELCRAQQLNPFNKDVYLVKYGNQQAQMITSKDVFTRRANANPNYGGFEAGVTFIDRNGKVQHREGSAIYKAAGEQLVGGWCKVFMKDRKPVYNEVTLEEYSTGKALWQSKPATMVRKVALVQSLREALDFQGLYTAEELGNAGDMVLTGQVQQNGPVQATTAPQVIDAEVVEAPANEVQFALLDNLARVFGEMRGKTAEEVQEAVMSSKAMAAAGAACGITTETQAQVAIDLLNSWIEKAQAAKVEESFEAAEAAEAPEVADVETGELYEQDVLS